MALLPTLRSKKFTVSIEVGGVRHKIFQIIFQVGKDSGNTYLMINFPYFSESKGLLSRATFPANTKTCPSISLIPEGKVTSHLVKYSHPLDGNAHFSGDGKIYTVLRNKSRRLDVTHNHMFTIQIQNLNAFAIKDDEKKLTITKTDVDFKFIDQEPPAIKFIGRWAKVTDIKGTMNPGQPQPQFAFRDNGETGFILSPPEESLISDFVLLLSCKGISSLDPNRKSVFSFIGGFNEEVGNITKDATFLTCIYPSEDFENLQKTIGSVDFESKKYKNS